MNSGHHRLAAVVLIYAGLAGSPAAAQPLVGNPTISGDAARQLARQLGLRLRIDTPAGAQELHSFVNGVPQYLATFNRASADTMSTDDCWHEGSAGLNLNGAGVRLGIWDGGAVLVGHQELRGRATQRDAAPATHWHATHVAGTMIARGQVAAARGMAPGAQLDCYDWTNDIAEMRAAAAAGLRVSNHSYGLLNGWVVDNLSQNWTWRGDVLISAIEDYKFGFYSQAARDYDLAASAYPSYLIVQAAGNDRNDTGPGAGAFHWAWINGAWTWNNTTRDPDGGAAGFDTLDGRATAKNILTVGAVKDIPGGYTSPASVVLTGFSSFGPTDDGRIKPDIVANGDELYSTLDTGTSAYGTVSGTSMAAPSVSGSLALLMELRARTAMPPLDAASLKAVVLHTADDAGAAAGPDYRFGWGLMNTRRAAQVIAEDAAIPSRISERVISSGQVITIPLNTSMLATATATVCWTDLAGPIMAPSLDPTRRILVHDLDVRIVRTRGLVTTTYFPWRLDPAAPSNAATRGDNARDNVEQVTAFVGDPMSQYALVISHKGALKGPQRFSIVLTGATF